MHKTYVMDLSSVQDPTTTPIKESSSETVYTTVDGDLDASFSIMSVYNNSKRPQYTHTIEGSPMVMFSKRRNSNPTPLFDRHSIIVRNENDLNEKCHEYNILGTTKSRQVAVLSSCSDSHDTLNHQENAKRTLVLSGPDGCLRRKELQSKVCIQGSNAVFHIKQADLLR